ncbi:WD40/YVTN repeat-like-containing domain-containing protein [Artemisia annua]|uniref:WD40/YVTN repeat-like-containing domain-containing protein n=1 Tax=Artemisia annua TaxID=35608 RepID=A0A2U1L0C7_ARTAN|nr:WD40/YVTN repeat-like-containing domain-containing protein [Artemisia annua]
MEPLSSRRITAAGGGACGNRRRVVATKRRDLNKWLSVNNSVKKLFRREISSKRRRLCSVTDSAHRFRNIRLTEQYDTHDPKGYSLFLLPFLMKRSKVAEIVAAHGIVFTLAISGVCAAFSRDTNKRICILNIFPDEVIRSLFYNKNNESLITVSVYASDNFSSLKCRSTSLEYIQRGQPDAGFPLFESESLKWPGFVEFDDVNGKVLTYSAQDSIYKVFDLKNYTLLYSVTDKDVDEIKIRSKVAEIVAAHGIVFTLAISGVCAAFSRDTNKRICILNIFPDEVIRSLFYNKNNESLITVSVYASDNFSSLKCRSTSLEYIQRGQPDAGFPLFESESLKWPGFVEFDDVNGKVLTYSAQDSIYKVFDLKNYTLLYSVTDKDVDEIKISGSLQ